MLNRWLPNLLCVGCFLVISVAWRQARAASLNQGTLSAQTDSQTPNTANFSTTPYTTPVTSTASDASSTTTPDVTGLVFNGSFSQSTDNNLATFVEPLTSSQPSAAGSFQVNFNANAGDTYSLSGGETPSGGTGSLSVSLYDNSTATFIYSYFNSGTVAIVADSSGGPTAGTLAAGVYTFSLSTSLVANAAIFAFAGLAAPDEATSATLTGSGGITLVSAVPEPATPSLLVLCCAPLLAGRRRKRTR